MSLRSLICIFPFQGCEFYLNLCSILSIFYPLQDSAEIYGDVLASVTEPLSLLFKKAHGLQVVNTCIFFNPKYLKVTLQASGLDKPIVVLPENSRSEI